ncbi:MAG TPA: energy-coupling factor transporter ATPase, partial [Ruminococcaceae bacterium]|nr:energy-coupling factor transporter ATPase [Oscillospiraceae bacterium]
EETVFKDIAFGPKNMKLDEAEIKQRVAQAADFVGLSRELLEKSPFDLSGGEKRRAAIAGVMAMKPKILVLDEPTAGLDPRGKESILNMILNYKRATGATVLLVTHSMEDVARIATKILVMNHAQVAMYDTVKNVFARSDELEQIGLAVPQITRICRELKKRGLNLDESIYTVDEACAALLPLLKGGRG